MITGDAKIQQLLLKLHAKSWGLEFIKGMEVDLRALKDTAELLHGKWSTYKLALKRGPEHVCDDDINVLSEDIKARITNLEKDWLNDATALK